MPRRMVRTTWGATRALRRPGSECYAPSGFPGVLLVIGLLLMVVGPVPGLGVFLVLGASLATFVVGMTALVGR